MLRALGDRRLIATGGPSVYSTSTNFAQYDFSRKKNSERMSIQDAVASQSVSGSLSWAAKTTLYPKWIEIAFD